MKSFFKTYFLILVILSNGIINLIANERIIYETNFEVDQGFNPNYELRDQEKWKIEGSAGNGFIQNSFGENSGNQAYIGAFKPNDVNEEYLIGWPEINGITDLDKKFTFSVSLMVADSQEGSKDYFQWAVFNSQLKPLITIDFDNQNKNIGYIIGQNGDLINSGFTFNNGLIYDLTMIVDLELRVFTLKIGGEKILDNIAINLNDTKFDFSEVNAVWSFSEIGNPGDNFMSFDDYKIVVDRSESDLNFIDEININDGIELNSINSIQNYLDKGVSPDYRISGSTLLTSAIFQNSKDIILLLLKYGANPNLWDDNGKSPLAIACEANNETIVTILLNNGSNIYYTYPDGENLLSRATIDGSVAVVDLLLNSKLNPDLKNSKEETPVHLASYNGNEEILFLLLSYGANINSENSNGHRPIDMCVNTTNYELANKIKDYIRIESEFLKSNSNLPEARIIFKIHTVVPGQYALGFKVPKRNVGILYSKDLHTWEDYANFELNDSGFNKFEINTTRNIGEIKFFKPAIR